MLPPSGYLYWWTTSAIIGLLTFFNFFSRIVRHVRSRCNGPSPHSLGRDESCDSVSTSSFMSIKKEKTQISFLDLPMPDRALGVGSKLARAVYSGYERCFGLVSVPVFLGKRHMGTLASDEVIWTVAYTTGVLFLSFYGTHWEPRLYANQAGWMAAAQMPLIIALAGKNNLVSMLTGISYERLNYLHRAAGRICYLCIWSHTAGHIILAERLKHFTWSLPMSQWAVVATSAYTIMLILSLRPIRDRVYEFFLYTHMILVALTLAGFIMHWHSMGQWIYPGIGLWAADRLFRTLGMVRTNRLWRILPGTAPLSRARITQLTPCTLRLSVPVPGRKWLPGQHFYILAPGVSRIFIEAHPFTAATTPNADGEVNFLIRVRDGFTSRLLSKLEKERVGQGVSSSEGIEAQVGAVVEGPYGASNDLSSYESVLLVGGGSGISYILSYVLALIEQAKAAKGQVRVLRVVWMIKSRYHAGWIGSLLAPALTDLPSTLRFTLQIHVTHPHAVPEPRPFILPTSATANQSKSNNAQAGRKPDPDSFLSRRLSFVADRVSAVTRLASWLPWTKTASESRSARVEAANAKEQQAAHAKAQKTQQLPALVWNDGASSAGSEAPIMSRPGSNQSYTVSGLGSSAIMTPSMSRNTSDNSVDPHSTVYTPNSSLTVKPALVRATSMSTGNSPQRPGFPRSRSATSTLSINSNPFAGHEANANRSSGLTRSYALSHSSNLRGFKGGAHLTPPGLMRSYSDDSVSANSFCSTGTHLVRPTTTYATSAAKAMIIPPEPTLSPVVDRYVIWREGRADIDEAIADMVAGSGRGNRVAVSVCGPARLADAARLATRRATSVRAAMDGQVVIDYYQEVFGW